MWIELEVDPGVVVDRVVVRAADGSQVDPIFTSIHNVRSLVDIIR